jgi:EAL domain-containing protein (putative c-di-GMP-specific phosphodiesterase class I)
LPVLAEGVETDAELHFLRDELCDEAQGYLLGRPGDIAGFRQLTHDVDAAPEDPGTAPDAVPLLPKASSM